MSDRQYRGDRTGSSPSVLVDGRPLTLPSVLRPREGYGYDWGRAVPGTEWLALALLYDATHDSLTARIWAQVYAADVLGRLHEDSWELTTVSVLRWLLRRYQVMERTEGCHEA